ncbi:hypothetical protein DY000_02045098 [Brassica cretica]|uniref:Histone chaperone domain-containing protein n=1 Tax=Brassica cretica TaxID=69181 RepID=A0ABQ7EUV7_BRACR|nr:hypothetical protein DY000_02045098 [Brassica cretica]
MADVENKPDSSFPVKRKPDLCCQGQDSVANKAQKLNPSSRDEEVSVSDVENLNSSTEASVSLEKAVCSVSEEDSRDFAAEEKQDGVGKEEEDDSIDRKGKGISREDKGKGRLIELGESDDSDDEEDEDGDEFDVR